MSLWDQFVTGVQGAFSGDDGKPNGDMRKVLDAYAALDPKPAETLTAVEARRQPTPADAVKTLLRADGKDPNDPLGVVARDLSIPTHAGAVPARLYRPDTDDGKARPLVLYWHGGGFVFADLDVYDASPRAIAKAADCIVLSCHYRQAPEAKWPAPCEDAIVAYQWARDNAGSLGADPERVAVMGESAGGNLALNVAIAARDLDLPRPAHMVLVYPLAGTDVNRDSFVRFADAKPLNRAMVEWFMANLMEPGADPSQDTRLNLVEAELSNLPDATIISAEIDPLLSEGQLLAERLETGGSKVHAHVFRGVTHEFFGMGLVVKAAAAAEAMAAHDLKKAFGTAVLPI